MCQAPLQVESHCEGRSSLGPSLGSTVSSLLSLVTGCPRGSGRSPPRTEIDSRGPCTGPSRVAFRQPLDSGLFGAHMPLLLTHWLGFEGLGSQLAQSTPAPRIWSSTRPATVA